MKIETHKDSTGRTYYLASARYPDGRLLLVESDSLGGAIESAARLIYTAESNQRIRHALGRVAP